MDDPVEKPGETWLSSVEARRYLRVSSCELMHLREGGFLEFRKSGNRFMYSVAGLKRRREQIAGQGIEAP